MSGLLDELRPKKWVDLTVFDNDMVSLAVVREALRSEETVRAVIAEMGWPETDVNVRDVRAVLAALAGDDQ